MTFDPYSMFSRGLLVLGVLVGHQETVAQWVDDWPNAFVNWTRTGIGSCR